LLVAIIPSLIGVPVAAFDVVADEPPVEDLLELHPAAATETTSADAARPFRTVLRDKVVLPLENPGL
jgi:hypothetical protein